MDAGVWISAFQLFKSAPSRSTVCAMNTIRALSLLAATLTMGLTTGAFALYAHTVMPGLNHNDDRTFVAAFQSMDRAIINPWFMLTAFLGAIVFTLAAVLTNIGRDPLPWAALALALYVVAVVITFAVNVPLNDALKAAGDPDRISDLAAVRERFDEARWATFNLVRTLLSAGAFVSLMWALVVHGQSA
jgi:uncharacterized membrane protein